MEESSTKFVIKDKKTKRQESKRKKAAALLSLLKQNKEDPQMADNDGNDSTTSLNQDDLIKVRQLLWERKKEVMQKPKVFLTPESLLPFRPNPEEPVQEDEFPPLYAMDLQQLILYALQGNCASYKPRWCKLLRVSKVSSVVLLTLEALSYSDYEQSKDCFPFISENFHSYVEMVCPQQYMQTLDGELFNVPLSVSQLKKTNVKVPKHVRETVVAKLVRPVDTTLPDRFSRTCLLLSTYQMMLEGYPLPVHTNIGRYRDFVFTKDKYEKVTAKSPLFALDCEMCVTTARKNELTRVSVVSETGTVLYDSLVKPRNKIINYLTRFSGITKTMLDPVTTTIQDVQEHIRRVLPADAILCGQSLNGDLIALKMFHPYVIDTSVIFNMSGNRYVKAGLRKLTQFFLSRTIQNRSDGHDSIEDAAATLDLVKLKLSKGLEFGDATLNGVYFPDIQTYFNSSHHTESGVVQNIENPAQSTGNSSVKNSDNCAVLQTSVPKSTTNHVDHTSSQNGCQQLSDVNGSSSSLEKDTNIASALPDRESSVTPHFLSLSPSSKPESDSDEESGSHQEPCAKKRKQQTSDPTGSDSSQKTSNIIKCNEYSFTSTTELVHQQKETLFNQADSVHVSHSFFKLIYEAGRSSCVIDSGAFIDKYLTEPVKSIVVQSDTEARKAAGTMVQTTEFVWTHFRSYSECLNESTLERKQKEMRRLDRRVASIMKHVKSNALVLVVMTGRNSEEIPHNIATFLTTT